MEDFSLKMYCSQNVLTLCESEMTCQLKMLKWTIFFSFQGGKYVRNYLLSSLGYVVISIDSRGSSNRGKAFESHIYKRLGQVEIIDQLEVLKQMEAQYEYLDLTRMAINGWSYGGYLALRGIMDFPHVFKVMHASHTF